MFNVTLPMHRHHNEPETLTSSAKKRTETITSSADSSLPHSFSTCVRFLCLVGKSQR